MRSSAYWLRWTHPRGLSGYAVVIYSFAVFDATVEDITDRTSAATLSRGSLDHSDPATSSMIKDPIKTKFLDEITINNKIITKKSQLEGFYYISERSTRNRA